MGFAQTSKVKLILKNTKFGDGFYLNEQVVFNAYVKNISSETISIPHPKMARINPSNPLLKSELNFYTSEGKLLNRKMSCGVGSSNYEKELLVGAQLKPNDSILVETYTIPKMELGKYYIDLSYVSDPSFYNSTSPKSKFIEVNEKIKFDFEVTEQKATKLVLKKIEKEEMYKNKYYDKLSDCKDSTNVYVLQIQQNVSQLELNQICKFKNIRLLQINSKKLDSIPQAIFDLNLFSLTLNVDTLVKAFTLPTTIKKSTDLESLTLKLPHVKSLENLDSKFEKLYHLSITHVKNDLYFPAFVCDTVKFPSLKFLNLENSESLKNFPSDLRNVKSNLGIYVKNCKSIELPQMIKGRFSNLNFENSSLTFLPDISELHVKMLNVNSLQTKELPDYLLNCTFTRLIIPNELEDTKIVKNLRKKGMKINKDK